MDDVHIFLCAMFCFCNSIGVTQIILPTPLGYASCIFIISMKLFLFLFCYGSIFELCLSMKDTDFLLVDV